MTEQGVGVIFGLLSRLTFHDKMCIFRIYQRVLASAKGRGSPMTSIQRVCIFSNQLRRSLETAETLTCRLEQKGFQVSENVTADTDLIVSIGGDGSFLKTMNDLNYPSIPVVSINTGHLGFFSEVNPDQINTLLERLEHNHFFIESMAPLKAVVTTGDQITEVKAINELVIKSNQVKAIHLRVKVNGQLIERFSGDGIIISTSAGSTAYSYSTGGSIVDPRIDVLQLTPLAPINTNSYRCFTSSVIFPPDGCINISPQREPEGYVLVSTDGIPVAVDYFDQISVTLDQNKIQMLRLKQHDFWNKVVKKFV